MRWLVMLLLLCPLTMEAQKRPVKKPAATVSPTTPFPIESVAISGNKEYSREQIMAAAGLKLGQMAVAKDFDAARARLEAAGVFDELAIKYAAAADKKGYAVSIQVAEAGPLFPVRFEDLGAPDEQVEKALKQSDPFYGPRIAATKATLARYGKVIEDSLAGKVKVVGQLVTDDTGTMAVVFRPPGALPAIARVTFTGNSVITGSVLENAINAVAVGTPWREVRFRQLLETNVRPLYEERGRVRVLFTEIKAEKDRDVNGMALTVKVEEGASYSLGEVTVDGSRLAAAELLKVANLKRGDVFNILLIQAGVARIEKRVRREGYMRVKTRIDRKVNDPAKTVGLAIHVEDGPRYLLAKLNIEGLDLISEPAIRQIWAIKEGQPFNADYPDYFLNRVREDGVLDDLGETKSKVKTDDTAKTVEVTLIFHGEVKKEPDKQHGERRP
ncbi:MAG: FtsQ-type POTRA domain-containing protein [Bryobacteraceae bacterium]